MKTDVAGVKTAVDNVDSDLVAVDNVIDAGVADLKALVQRNGNFALTGTTADVVLAMTGLNPGQYPGAITLTTAHTLEQLATINIASDGVITLADYTIALSGTAEQVAAALSGNFGGQYTGNVTITDANYTVAQLKTINGATTGSITLNQPGAALSGLSADVVAALAGTITKHTGTVTLTNNPDASQLKAINAATDGAITLNVKAALMAGTADDLVAAFAGNVTEYGGTLQVTTAPTLAQLKAINAATSGAVHLNITNGPLVGSAADLIAAFAGNVTQHTGTITITDAPTAAQLKIINDNTNGAITLNVTNGALSGTAADLEAAFAGVVTQHTGAVTITDQPTLGRLLIINTNTDGPITLDVTNGALSGTALDLAAAFNGITTYTGQLTVTNAPDVAKLKAINAATSGAIVLQVTNGALSGTAADVAAALTGNITQHTGTVTLTDAPTVAQLKTINGATDGAITLNVTNGALSGTAADLVAAFAGNITPHTGTVTITNAPNVAQLKAINAATTGDIILEVTNGQLTGTSADLVAAFAGTVTQHTGTVTLTNGHSLADLKAINNATSGQITLQNYTVALTGSSADVAAALDGNFAAQYNALVTLTDAPTVAQLKTINDRNNGDITLQAAGGALSGTAADLVAAFAGNVTQHTGPVTITNAPNVAQLKAINAATDGAITLAVTNGALSGSAADLEAAFAGVVTQHTGAVTITDQPTLARLKTINANTDGAITLNVKAGALAGTSTDLAAAFAGTVTPYDGQLTITNNNYTLTELKAINNASTGAVVLQAAGAALSGSAADFVAAFAGNVTQHTGTVTITDAPDLSQLKTINANTDGDITLNVTNGPLSGTAADLVAAFAGNVTQHTGAVTITDAPTNAQLKLINDATSGTITLNTTNGALAGTAAEVAAALAGAITTHTGTVNVTTNHNFAQLKTISGATSGVITLNSYNVALAASSASMVTALSGNFAADYTGEVTLTDNHNLAQLKAVNNGTTGTINLNSYAIDLQGSAADITAALHGQFGAAYTGKAILTSDHNLVQLKAINNATQGAITLHNKNIPLEGTTADLTAALDGFGANAYGGNLTITDVVPIASLVNFNNQTSGTVAYNAIKGGAAALAAAANLLTGKAVTITDAPDLAQLKAINAATVGDITLEVTNGALSGTAADLVAAFAGNVTQHTGTVTITDAPSAAQLKIINDNTNGAITLNVTNGALSGTAADLAAAFAGQVTQHTGTVTITDAPTAAQLKTINDASTGDITLNVTDGALSGTAAVLVDAFAGVVTQHTGTVTLTDAPTVAQLKAINEATNGAITLQDVNAPLNGTVADVLTAFNGQVTQWTGQITLTDNPDAQQLKSINEITDGTIVLGANNNPNFTGTAAVLGAAFAGTVNGVGTGTITFTDAPNVAQLKAANAATGGAIVLQAAGGALSGTAADLVAAFAGNVTQHTGPVTITNAPNVAQLKAINAATDGAITLAVTNGALSGSAADLEAAFAGVVTQHTGAVTITDQPTLARLKTINANTDGAITLNVKAGALSGTAADLVAAFAGTITTYEGELTVTDAPNVSQLKAINEATSGAIVLNVTNQALSGTAADLAAAFAGTITKHAAGVTITDAPTAAQLKIINGGTNGDITLNVTTGPLTGTAADVAAALAGNITQHTGAVTLTDAPDAGQLKAINAKTNGGITLQVTNGALTGTSSDLAAAFAGTVTQHTGTVTITNNNYNVAELKAINAATDGAITLNAANVPLTGTTADVVAALDGNITQHNAQITLTSPHNLAQLIAINNATDGAIVLNANNVPLEGTGAQVAAALAGFGGNAYAGDVTLTGAATNAEIAAISAATSGTVSLANNVALSGTAAEMVTTTNSLNNFGGNVTVTDNHNLAQLKAINAKTSGTISLNNYGVALTGTAADVSAALAGNFGAQYNALVTLADAPTVAQLQIINVRNDGNIVLQVKNGALSGSAADVAAALAGTITEHTGTVTLTTAPTAQQLKAINDKTTGAITLNVTNGPLSGTAAELAGAFAGDVTQHTGTVTVTDQPTLDRLKTINANTDGAITLNVTGGALAGTAADLVTAFTGITSYTGQLTITNQPTAAQLKTINDATSGAIVLNNATGALSGPSAVVAAALAGTITQHNAAVTLTDAPDLAQLKLINSKTDGAITLDAVNGPLTGSAADVAAALAGTITKHNALVTLTTAPTVAELKAINAKTDGNIVLQVTNGALTGTSSDLEAAFAGTVTQHTGTVTITNNNYTVAELKAINTATDGDIILNVTNAALTGTSSDLEAAFAGTVTQHTGTVTITNNNYTVAELKAINGSTDGAITLNNAGVALSGTAADVKEALSGQITNHTGTITFAAGAVAAADIIAIDTPGTSTLSGAAITGFTGSAADIAAALNDFNTPPNNAVPAVITASEATTDQIQALTDHVKISTINGSAITKLTGNTAGIINAYAQMNPDPANNAIVITAGQYTAADINTIGGLTTGTINGSAITQITGTPAEVIAAYGHLDTDPANVTVVLTEAATLAQLKSIDGFDGNQTITATVTDTATNLAAALTADTNVYRAYIEQASNVQITGYTNANKPNLSNLSNIQGGTTFELIAAESVSLTHADALNLNVIDQITVAANNVTVTLSGESFTPGAKNTHFASLSKFATANNPTGAVIEVADYAGDGSVIDLKQITTAAQAISVNVLGDSGANVIQLSAALTHSGSTFVDLGNDNAADRLYLNADINLFKGGNDNAANAVTLGYTNVSNFQAGEDDLGLFYGNTSAFLGLQEKDAPSVATQDQLFIENESGTTLGGPSAYDTVGEVRKSIANLVTQVAAPADKFLMAEYNVDGNNVDAYLFAAQLKDVATNDLQHGNAGNQTGDVEIASIARLTNLGAANVLTALDLTVQKQPNTLS